MCFSCKCLRWTVVNIPLDFKFPFQNKSVSIKSSLINEMTHQLGKQMKNKMQVKV